MLLTIALFKPYRVVVLYEIFLSVNVKEVRKKNALKIDAGGMLIHLYSGVIIKYMFFSIHIASVKPLHYQTKLTLNMQVVFQIF